MSPVSASRHAVPVITHVHVIPVPEGMTAADAWTEITTLGRLYEPDAPNVEWATIECDGVECADIESVA